MKSFGYGIMLAELVPSPDLSETTNGNKKTHTDDLNIRIGKAGFGNKLQEVYVDPGNPGRAFILLSEGFEPTMYEKNQTSDEDMDSMVFIAELHSGGAFDRRLEMLKKAHSSGA